MGRRHARLILLSALWIAHIARIKGENGICNKIEEDKIHFSWSTYQCPELTSANITVNVNPEEHALSLTLTVAPTRVENKTQEDNVTVVRVAFNSRDNTSFTPQDGGTNVTVNSLQPGTRYNLQLHFRNKLSGTSVASLTGYTLPSKPTNFKETQFGVDGVTVKWYQRGGTEQTDCTLRNSGCVHGFENNCVTNITHRHSKGNDRCVWTGLSYFVKYTAVVTVHNGAQERATETHHLKLIRVPDTIKNSSLSVHHKTPTSVTLTFEDVGATSGVASVGFYVVRISGHTECLAYRKADFCQQVEGCKETPLTETTREKLNTVTLTVHELQQNTTYDISVTSYFCNITEVTGETESLNVTTPIKIEGEFFTNVTAESVKITWQPKNIAVMPENAKVFVEVVDAVPDLPGSDCSEDNRRRQQTCEFEYSAATTSCTITRELNAFWEYNVSLSISGQTFGPKLCVTSTTEPGPVQDLGVTIKGTHVTVTWGEVCPQQRNDFILRYNLTLTDTDTDTGEPKDLPVVESALNGITEAAEYRRAEGKGDYRAGLLGVVPGDEYMIEVWAESHSYPGQRKHQNFTIPISQKPEVPSSDEIRKIVPQEKIQATDSTLSFAMTNISFLLDVSTGRIVKKGMILVPNSKDDKQHLFNYSLSGYEKVRQWNKTVRKPYRVDFTASDLDNEYVVLGDDNATVCKTKGEYCDGPLRPSTVYSVYVFVCNKKWCRDFRVIDKLRTKSVETAGLNMNALVISVLILGLAAWVGLGLLAYFLCFRKRRRPRPISEDSGSSGIMMAMRPRNTKPMVLVNLETTIAKKQRDEGLLLLEEYEEIRKNDVKYPYDASLLDINRPKNRFADVMAFDHTRVKLSPDFQGSDYINANFLPGYNGEQEYIATQGPLPSTISDFWRMTWEHHVSIVVMLTQTIERGTIKCEHYWPADVGEVRQYGDITVTNTSVSFKDGYTVTILNLQHEAEDEERELHHLHYLKWPDMTADVQLTTLLHFVAFVRQHVRPDNPGPIVVHCSAGVGRTGTYICIDYTMQFIRERAITDHLDIYGFIVRLRRFRCRMVQTDSQYTLIHVCARQLMAARRQKDLERRELDENRKAASTNTTTHPFLNSAQDETKVAKPLANSHAERVLGPESEFDDEGTDTETVEAEVMQRNSLMAQGMTGATAGYGSEEDEEPPADEPVATSSMEQLFVP